jgi:hypothetical protein
MSDLKPWLRPSILPKLALCAHYRSEANAGAAAERGTKLDVAFRDTVTEDESDDGETGDNDFPTEADAEREHAAKLQPFLALLDGKNIETTLDADDRAAVRWAVDTAKALAGNNRLESREEVLRVEIFGMTGTADLLCEPHWSADLKSGQKRNYVEQQAAYALGFMEQLFVDEWTVYLLYCDQQEIERLHFTIESARQIVREVLAKANSSEPPQVNDYCGWCARRFECPARKEALGIAPFEGPGAITFEEATSDQLREYVIRARIIEDFKDKAREILKERTVKGENTAGVSLTSRKGNRKLPVVHLAPVAYAKTVVELLDGLPAISEEKAKALWESAGVTTEFPTDKVQQLPGSSFVRVSKPKKEALK